MKEYTVRETVTAYLVYATAVNVAESRRLVGLHYAAALRAGIGTTQEIAGRIMDLSGLDYDQGFTGEDWDARMVGYYLGR